MPWGELHGPRCDAGGHESPDTDSDLNPYHTLNPANSPPFFKILPRCPTVVSRDFSYADRGFDEAIELARTGNPHVRHHLERFVRRVPDSPEGQRAAQFLSEFGEQG